MGASNTTDEVEEHHMRSFTHFYWRRCIRLLLVMLLALAQPLAFATHVNPTFEAGNPTCSGLGYGAFELKFDNPADGSLTSQGVTITIDVRTTGAGPVFDWEASGGVVNAVVAKGGPNANLYVYNPGATSDTGLHSPVNPSNGKYYGLSHISFCFTPGEPSIDVTKACTEQTVNGNVLTTKNTVTLLNDGNLLLNNIQIREDTSGPSCSLTKVGGSAVNVPLTVGDYVTVPNGGTFTGSLAIGASVELEVICTSAANSADDLNVANTITGKGSSSNGDDDDSSTSDPAVQCPFSPRPAVSIDKDCPDDRDVRLMAMDGVLVAQVCPTIIVTNTSLTDPLKTAFVTDAQIPALAGIGVDAIAEAGLTQLNPGASINLGDFVDLCYLPSAPEVSAFDDNGTPDDPTDDKYQPSYAGFLNEATVDATGLFGGVDPTDSDDTALRGAGGEILYLLDENGERVPGPNGEDIPLSECPLCAPCPECIGQN
ncbi:hypothetical protein ACUTAF_20865 [Pseudomonas sp. SP16.1]|uniref:hypothetical protein n=1 Tax=Pseudomonas sp. SP16.1 TaxID=3458854 RepID=UPI004045FF13